MSGEIVPVSIDVPEAELAELGQRLWRTRWPESETVGDWSQGVPLAWLRNLCGYWSDGYDRRGCEARLNALAQYCTEIDGIAIYFLHVRSPVPHALPPGFLSAEEPCHVGGVGGQGCPGADVQRGERCEHDLAARDVPGRHG